MTKICVCGHFGGNEKFYDGQTIKTKTIYKALTEKYGKKEVSSFDTYKWQKNPFKVLINCIKAIKNSENVIIMPAQNGVKVFVPLFLFLKRFYCKKIFYIVIGGWLPELLKKKRKLAKRIKTVDKIFVETEYMKEKLEQQNIKNVAIMPNFKNIKIIGEREINKNIQLPIKICTFSRVIKEKGIEDAIKVIEDINKKHNRIIAILHVYGSISKEYKKEFLEVINKTSSFIEYKGIIESNNSVDVLKNYDFLLFPTYYEGEGFAGTIIDAMAAGLPIVASDWKYNNEIIKEGFNGYLYKVHNNLEMQSKIEYLIKNTSKINELKLNCIKEAQKYLPNNCIELLISEINDMEKK